MKKMAKVESDCGGHRARLMEKRASVLSGLGTRFDTLAGMGRVAEDDQAQISHDEFVSLRMNGLDFLQLRLVEEALDRLPAILASAWAATSRSPKRDCARYPGRNTASRARRTLDWKWMFTGNRWVREPRRTSDARGFRRARRASSGLRSCRWRPRAVPPPGRP
jgi:hypothetical protein